MLDWLLAPIDAIRAHEVDSAVAWHARSMTLGWAVIAPLAVLAARYLKVPPWQDWPRSLDSQLWWRCHWIGLTAAALLTVFGMWPILGATTNGSLHGALGKAVLALLAAQIALGLLRGSKGGPTAPGPDGSPRGDHYDMTPRRVIFERAHKGLGLVTLSLALAAVAMGLHLANAPRWMWLAIGIWWTALALVAFALQRRGWAVDTYQAIWGPDSSHPGNRRAPIGWGVRRIGGDRNERND